ncbi:MAG TPA: hypothetical protein VEA41_04625 [Salinarimonas sp.]|jgi:hypothetical protein|nr:hypothetical protein [Salinarimonas sp.]
MRVALLASLALVAGLALGWALSMGGYVLYFSITGRVDREGAAAMGVAFGIGPLVGLALGIGLAAAVALRSRRRA